MTPHTARSAARRSDATGPLSLVPRRRRSPLARVLRFVAFPAVVLAVLAVGGWETHRIVLAQQPTTTVLTSPTLTAPWGRVVVLRTATSPAPGGGRVVDVAVRVVGTAAGTFDPSTVTLRTGAGDVVPASLGAARPVRLAAGRVVEGHLGFVVPPSAGPLALVLAGPDGTQQQVGLRSAAATGSRPTTPPTGWVPGA